MNQILDLAAKAEQQRFGNVVGITQPAVAKHVKSGLLPRGGTYGEWLALYADQLRKEAAGRSGETQQTLAQARIEESRENAAEKKQRRLTAARQLLLRSDIEHLVLELAATIRQTVVSTGESMQESIESKYSVELTDDDITEPLRSALGHVADRAGQFVESLAVDTE